MEEKVVVMLLRLLSPSSFSAVMLWNSVLFRAGTSILAGPRAAPRNGGGGGGEEGVQIFCHGGEVVNSSERQKRPNSYFEDVYAPKDALRSLDKTFVLPKPLRLNFSISTLIYNATGAEYRCSLGQQGVCTYSFPFLEDNVAVL